VAADLVLKGKIYYRKQDYNAAIQMAESGLKIAEKYNLPAITMESTNLLGLVYADLGLYQKAYHFITQSNKLDDSLTAGENYRRIAQLEMQRAFDEKQKETELKHLQENLKMEAELERNKLVKNFFIIAGLLFILLGIYIYRNFLRSRRSEKEKEILLKEIHHRVKNNLQIISSLLNLQSGTLSDDLTKTAVIESRSRVKSMALIHQLLYQSEMFTNINFATYLEQLMSSLHSTYCKPGENIRYKISAEPIKLDIDTAIPMGLIINELATNAYKYAFQEKKEGNIEICLTKQPDHSILLSIADNGIGLPKKIDIQKTNSLGLRLVNLLVKQLKANINHECKNGTIIKIWIPSAA
jgi:two-component sensor histidine kinase